MGNLYILATAVLWSTAGLIIKYLPWNAFAIAGARGLLSMLLLMGFRRVQMHRGLSGALPHFTKANVRVGIFMFLTSTCYTLAIKLTSAANAVVLQYIAPVLVMLYAAVFDAQKPDKKSILLTIVVFIGCVLTFAGKLSPQGIIGNLVAVLSGFALAAQVIASRREKCDALDGLIIGSGISFLTFFPLLFREPVETFTPTSLGAIAFLGLFQYGLANVCYARGVEKTDAITTSLLLTLEPVLTPVWVFFSTGEIPSPLEMIGFFCVVGAVSLQSLLSARKESLRKTKN